MKYFILGTNPTLSLAEIASVAGASSDISNSSKNVLLIVNPDKNLDVLQERLAGTIKSGNIVAQMEKIDIDEVSDLISMLALEKRRKKYAFGISVYDCGNDSLAKSLKNELQKIGLEVKRKIRKRGFPARFVASKKPELSSVIIITNNLLESGGEFVLIASPQGALIGQTETVQDFMKWSKRDYERPRRDAKSGMLPPKLARMMVNFSGFDSEQKNKSLLDPFCGSGTVLMEAALLGFGKITGSDISEKAIADSKKNLNWLKRNFDAEYDLELIQSPADRLDGFIEERVDLIVTETFLGPPLKGKETRAGIENNIKELMKMYVPAFKTLSSLLKPGGKMVVAFPAFVNPENKNEFIFLPIKKELQRMGFSTLSPLPKNLPENLSKTTPSGGLLYHRKGQRVAREIFVMGK